MLISILQVVGGLALLAIGADKFVDGSVWIAHRYKLSPMITGLVIVGFATSAPELLVGVSAAIDGKTEIAIGNAIGSNITNISLALGMTMLCVPICLLSISFVREYIVTSVAMLAAFLMMLDTSLDRIDGILLLFMMFALFRYMLYMRDTDTCLLAEPTTPPSFSSFPYAVSIFLLGLLMMIGGAELMISGATTIARYIGVSDLVIGLTIVAVGTSLPELSASLVSALKGRPEIAIGNVVGSNIFNILLVLSVPGVIYPTAFSPQVLWRDFAIMFGLHCILAYLLFIRRRLSRIMGLLLLFIFGLYQYSLLWQH